MGQIPHRAAIANITNALPCVVTTVDDHEFTSGSFVRLTDLNGMMPTPRGEDQLNNYRFRIVVIDDTNFLLQNPITFEPIDSRAYPPYVTGGSANIVPTDFYFYPQGSESYPNPDDIVPNP